MRHTAGHKRRITQPAPDFEVRVLVCLGLVDGGGRRQLGLGVYDRLVNGGAGALGQVVCAFLG
jgi:hypothetical protein